MCNLYHIAIDANSLHNKQPHNLHGNMENNSKHLMIAPVPVGLL